MPISGKIPAIRFNLKESSDSDKETLIYLFFRYNKKRLKYSTGEKVKPIYWDGRRAKSTKKHPEYAAINSRLNNLENHTTDIFTEHNFGEISLVDFKLELDFRSGKRTKEVAQAEEEATPPTLFEFIALFIEEEKNKVDSKRGTWKK